jgi:hypothetical protein
MIAIAFSPSTNVEDAFGIAREGDAYRESCTPDLPDAHTAPAKQSSPQSEPSPDLLPVIGQGLCSHTAQSARHTKHP